MPCPPPKDLPDPGESPRLLRLPQPLSHLPGPRRQLSRYWEEEGRQSQEFEVEAKVSEGISFFFFFRAVSSELCVPRDTNAEAQGHLIGV